MAGGVEYQVTKVDPTNPETKGMVYQVHKVTEEVAATLGGKVYRARIIKDPSDPTVAGKVYQIVLIGDPEDPAVKGKVYNAILTGGSEAVVIGPAVSPLSLPDAVADSLEYLKAFGGTEQRNIPQPYTQVNYVTNTAQTMINTGIKFDFSKNYEIELKASGVAGPWYILQARESSTSPISGISGPSTGDVIGLNFDGAYVTTSQISRVFGHIYYVKGTINNGNMTLYVKDETAGTEETVTKTYTPKTGQSVDICLFGNTGRNYVAINSDVYFARIKENGVTVMDYVPARQVATAGFYDKASGTFKTALTPANLSADGDTVPSPDYPMDIISNNGVLKARHQSGLPLGYQLLDYIESTGTQYIDTAYTKAQTKDVEAQISITQTTSAFQIFYGLESDIQCALSRDGHWVNYGGVSDTTANLNTWYNTRLDFTNRTLYIDGDAVAVGNAGTNTGGIKIFNNTSYKSYICMKSFKIHGLNGNLICNMVPAKRNSDNAIGMYDTITGTFFTNAGTGTFVAGNPVNDIEVYADGTVETINVHGKNLFDGQWQIGVYSTSTGAYSSTSNRICNVNMIQVKPSTTYTVSCPDYALAGGMRWLFYDANKKFISAAASGVTTITTPSNAKYINFYIANNLTVDTAPDLQIEQGSTATTYEPYFDGGTATAEMLLKVGTYQDVQSIIDGVVMRKVGVKVLDGTEDWQNLSGYMNIIKTVLGTNSTVLPANSTNIFCTHFQVKTNAFVDGVGSGGSYINFKYDSVFTTLAQFKQWLADQYAAGTPVTVIYPLAQAVTEQVAPQVLNVQTGDNILEITQASLSNLELEAKYKKSA